MALRKEGARICNLQADLYYRKKEYGQASDMCKRALIIYETDLKANLLLSKIYKEEMRWGLVSQHCISVLQIDPHNDEANLMLADYHYLKNEAASASVSYQALLNVNPRKRVCPKPLKTN